MTQNFLGITAIPDGASKGNLVFNPSTGQAEGVALLRIKF